MERSLPFFRKFRTDRNFYGLLAMPENCFYIVDTDYHVIKLVQFILMKQKFFFCINISKFESDFDTSLIDNNNCHEFGCIPKSVKYIMLDSDPGMHLTRIIASPASHNDILKTNLILLQKLLHSLEQVVGEFEEQENRRFHDQIQGLNEFKDFVKATNPNDENIDDFVEQEISLRSSAVNRSRPYRDSIINLLTDIDYQKNDVKEIILEKIECLEFGRSDYINADKKKMFLSDIFKKTLASTLLLHR